MTSRSVRVVPIDAALAEPAARFFADRLEDTFAKTFPPEAIAKYAEDQSVAALAEQVQRGDRVLLAAVRDGRIEGVLFGSVPNGGVASVVWIVVAPSARNERLGERLMLGCFRQYAERGCHKVVVYTETREAFGFYGRVGMRHEGTHPDHWWGRDHYCLALALNEAPEATASPPYRRIQTPLPAPGSLPALDALHRHEPRATQGQPPILWDRAEGFQVHDRFGNTWLDFTSGVLVANAGHSPTAIVEAVRDAASDGRMFSYSFATEVRARLVERLAGLAPSGLDKVFLLSTGSEATEAALKLAKTRALRAVGPQKRVVVHFENAFHGRTMGAQLAGGSAGAKEWIGPVDGYVQAPYPDGYWSRDTGFGSFTSAIEESGVDASDVAAVIVESYQGGVPALMPAAYVRGLRDWCDAHDVCLIFDEIQSGFGRTGKLFAFEHYGVTPDLVCLGKAITGSLPLAAVLGRGEILDLYEPGEMSSTHGGNPLSCAAALANLDLLTDELFQQVARDGEQLQTSLQELASRFPERIGAVHGAGFVYGLPVRTPGTERDPDPTFARHVVDASFEEGLLMFAPVGPGGATIKICPPLVTPLDALLDGVGVLSRAFERAELGSAS